MNWSYDVQLLRLRVRSDMLDQDSLWCAAQIDFRGIDPEEFAQHVMDEVFSAGFVGYALKDEKYIEAMGAGMSARELLLNVVAGTTEAAVATFLEHLFQKISGSRKTSRDGYDPRRSTASARRFIEAEFRPVGELAAVDVSFCSTEVKFVFEDSVGTRYIVEMDPAERFFVARRVIDH